MTFVGHLYAIFRPYARLDILECVNDAKWAITRNNHYMINLYEDTKKRKYHGKLMST